MHTIIVGMTGSGKTTLAKSLAKSMRKMSARIAVLDPIGTRWESVTFQTSNSKEFLQFAKQHIGYVLYIDEGSESVGRYNVEMQWLATQSRQWGHSAFFITQSCTQMAPIVRQQCETVYVFGSGQKQTKLLAEEWRQPDIEKVGQFDKGEFFIVPRFGDMQRAKIDFATGKVTMIQSNLFNGDKHDDQTSGTGDRMDSMDSVNDGTDAGVDERVCHSTKRTATTARR